jgi:D-alanyl-D-alanine carboxypeptidase
MKKLRLFVLIILPVVLLIACEALTGGSPPLSQSAPVTEATADRPAGYPAEESPPETETQSSAYPAPPAGIQAQGPAESAYPALPDAYPAPPKAAPSNAGASLLPTGAVDPALTNRVWTLQQVEGPAGQTLLPETAVAELNAIEFYPDGRVSIIAGCNIASGRYETGSGTIRINAVDRSDNGCQPGSLGTQFRAWLGETVSYTVDGDTLSLSLPGSAGALTLQGSTDFTYGDQLARFMVVSGGLDTPLAAPETVDELLAASLDNLVYRQGDEVDLALGLAPGAVVLVQSPQGSKLQAMGLADVQNARPISVLDRLELGSNTSMFTAVLLAQFVEEDLLTLDDTIAQWLPQLAQAIPYGESITLRQLATHTAGLPDYAGDIIGAGSTDYEALRSAYTPEELVRYAIENGPPDFAPGTPGRWQYSNTGYILLGMILEAASGQSYANLLQARIFDPLGMDDTLLLDGIPEPGLITEGYFVYPYDRTTTEWNASQGWSAGGIASTATDMAKFARGLMSGALFQDPATLKLMTNFERVAGNSEVALAGGEGYGLGLIEFAPGLWGHRGQTVGFTSIVAMDPARDFILIALTNAAEAAISGEQELMGHYLHLE